MSATQGTDSEKSKGGHILSSIVRMANWLKLPVIAEGIETGIQADYLKSIGCFYMQGYYFAKPMPVEEYEKLLFELPLFNTKPQVNTEVVEVSKLLDASTHTTLMFNSFVGGAAIIEWASKVFDFTMPQIKVEFHKETNRYLFDFCLFFTIFYRHIHLIQDIKTKKSAIADFFVLTLTYILPEKQLTPM